MLLEPTGQRGKALHRQVLHVSALKEALPFPAYPGVGLKQLEESIL